MSSPEKTPLERLFTPVQFLKGVGPQRAELLDRLGLHTARDVLFSSPATTRTSPTEREVDQLEEGKLQSVRGTVEDIDLRSTGAGRCVLGVLVRCQTGLPPRHLVQPAVHARQLRLRPAGAALRQAETATAWSGKWPIPAWRPWPTTKRSRWAGSCRSIRLPRACSSGRCGRSSAACWTATSPLLGRGLPAGLSRGPRPLAAPPGAAARSIFPATSESLASARRRFVYQELFVLQLGLAVKRRQQHAPRQAPRLEATAQIDARIRRLFPFELTAGQQQAIAEIAADMARPLPMNRLLQGDVGSGKTMVAVYAMLLAVAHRLPGGADGAHRSPRPAARPDARSAAGRQPGPPRAVDRRPAGQAARRSCWSRSRPARSTWSWARRRSSRRTSTSPGWGWW